MAKFFLATSFGYVKTEKREIEHAGEIRGDHSGGLTEAEYAAIRDALDPRRQLDADDDVDTETETDAGSDSP